MIGDEFKTARKFLLENLEGGIAWKDPEQAERQKERLKAKKEKEAKKKQKVTVIKEIRCGITIEENDIAIKAKNARKFLVDGDKVKITIRFKGREAALSHLGVKILDNFVSKLEDVCVVEKPAKQDGRNMTMVLAPKKA